MMAPDRDTTVSQARSRSAVLGYLAAAAEGLPLDRPTVAAWFERQGLAIRERGLRDALKLRLRRYGDSEPASDPMERAWVRETVECEATKLDLDLAILLIPRPEDRAHIISVLRQTERVTLVYEGYEGDLFALVVYDGARERQRIQTLIEEHVPDLRWTVIRNVDRSLAQRTWLSLASKVASEEGLLSG
jgi:hypothetical protein